MDVFSAQKKGIEDGNKKYRIFSKVHVQYVLPSALDVGKTNLIGYNNGRDGTKMNSLSRTQLCPKLSTKIVTTSILQQQ